MSNDALIEFLNQLWGQAYGGSDVAVQLNIDNDSPTAKPAAGVEESVRWMRENLDNSDLADQIFLFLVGGPGGGKSAAAQRISAGFRLTSEPDPLASRIYEYATPAGRLRVVNDATIPRADGRVTTLLTDISEAMDNNYHLLVCANRGVITDNLGDTEFAKKLPHAYELLNMLHNSGQLSSPRTLPNETQWEDGHEWSFIRSKLIENGKSTIRMVAVFLDECSLFEPSPNAEIKGNLPCRKDPYEILTFTTLAHDISSVPNLSRRLDSPAADLLEELYARIPERVGISENPLTANFSNLRDSNLRLALLNFLRGSEIISDRRLTYRDLWATYARVFAGYLPNTESVGGAVEAVQAELHVAKDQGRSSSERWNAVAKLGRLRYFMSLFEFRRGPENEEVQPDQLSQIFNAADATSDSSSRWDRSNRSNAPDSNLGQNLIFDAFSIVDEYSSPLDFLKRNLLDAKSESADVVLDCITPFEELVDSIFLNVLKDGTDSEIFEATQWYGLYLSRLLHMSLGVPAFTSSVRLWTRQWTNSWSSDSQILPELESGFQSLVNPPTDSNAESLVATFGSRAEAVTDPPEDPLLVTKLSNIRAATRAEGERLWVRVKTDTEFLGQIRLDFELIRLIQASVEIIPNLSVVGLTEKTDLLEPRLERLRSSQLGGTSSSHTFVINKTGQEIIFSLLDR